MSACYLRARWSLWCLSCSSSFTENMAEPSMYICHIKQLQRYKGFRLFHLAKCRQQMFNKNFLYFLTGHLKVVDSYCALGTILHIVDRKFDLRLLRDHRVLKESYTTQEDRITGPLQRENEKDEMGSGLWKHTGRKSKHAVLYLNDFSLSVLGPEGLGRSGAADSNEAGWLTIQRRSNKFTAGCNI